MSFRRQTRLETHTFPIPQREGGKEVMNEGWKEGETDGHKHILEVETGQHEPEHSILWHSAESLVSGTKSLGLTEASSESLL